MPLVVYAAKEKSSKKKTESLVEDNTQKEKEEAERKANEINQKIQENQGAISDAQSEKDKLKTGMDQVQNIINGLQSEKNNLQGYVTKLDASLLEIQNEISDLNDQIDTLDEKIVELDGRIENKKKEIAQAEADLKEAQKELDEQYENTKLHIRYMYETRTNTYFDVLASASGIQDLLNRAEYISCMAEYDQEQLKEFAKAKKAVEEREVVLNQENQELQKMKSEVENTKNEVSEHKDEVAEKEAGVSALITVKEQEIGQYEADINNKEQLVKEYKSMIAAQDAIIRNLEAAIEAQRAALEAAAANGEDTSGSLRKYDGGKFTFPAPSYTRVSDDYGNRIHPTLGVQQFHNGIDLAAPSGSPILAAYDGTVIAADYSSTMGNYIMIDHGDGLFTIYMHSSSLLVSKGASVSKGQKIALVGSTGRSTGPHLHFSVRSGGNYVSPWNYLK